VVRRGSGVPALLADDYHYAVKQIQNLTSSQLGLTSPQLGSNSKSRVPSALQETVEIIFEIIR
jgi:hypothetical protein